MYKISDIVDYIFYYENQQGRGVSNLRLQKLLYFIQVQSIIALHEPLFQEPIEAWDFGPVVPKVYHKYKIFGGSNIPIISTQLKKVSLPDKVCKEINTMLDACAKYSTTELTEITYKQLPWKKAYARTIPISTNLIKDYYKY